jgi:multidrug efflux pump subunit AcrA (membrane-fusion protein)
MIIPKKILAVSLVVIVLGVAAYFLFVKKGAAPAENQAGGTVAAPSASPSADASNQAQSQEPQPLAVKAVRAVKGDLVISLKSPGEAFTTRLVVVKAEVGGVIKSLNVAEGRHVREGDILLEIDDREYRLRLEKQEALRLKYLSEVLVEKEFGAPDVQLSAEAQDKIARAKADLEKAGELFAKGQLSDQELEKAQRAL